MAAPPAQPRRAREFASLAALLLTACTARQEPAATSRPQSAPARESKGEAPAAPEPSASDAKSAKPAPVAEAAPDASQPKPVFPPPNVIPPHERSAQPGDGVWQLLGDSALAERAATDPRVLARTVIHPHPTSRFISVTVAAIDLGRARLGYVSGTDDPEPRTARLPRGVIPTADLAHALAIFNGGFQPKHGWWGMRAGGEDLVRPRADGCTVALFRDGRIRIAPWPDIEPLEGEVVAFRQTPPCLLSSGTMSSRLTSGNLRIYGGDTADVKTRRRSGIGIDPSGAYLFFAISEEGDARHLAEGLRVAGASSAAQLDINWNWTRFILIGDTPDGPRLTSALVSGMTYGKREYVERATARDFFYVVRSAP